MGHLTAQHLYVYDGDLKAQDARAAEIEEIDKRNDRDADALEPLIEAPAVASAYARFEETETRYTEAVESVIAQSRRETTTGLDDRSGSRTGYTDSVVPFGRELQATAAAVADAVQKDARETADGTEAEAVSARQMIVVVGLLSVMLALVIATLVTLSILRPVKALGRRLRSLDEQDLHALTSALDAAAAGDLTRSAVSTTQPVDVTTSDELGRLAATFNSMLAKAHEGLASYNTMRAQLAGVLGEVSLNAGTVSAASQQMASTSQEAGRAVGEIASAVGDVSQGAERQVRMVESTRSAVKQAARAATVSADTARSAAASAEKARDVAGNGVTAAHNAMRSIQELAESSDQVVEAIRDLSQRSDRIGGIVDTITSIAEQTNLLALNAAIEAARAGDQGRGFAVVADEVRKLAENSQNAAAEIAGLVMEIQAETSRVVAVVTDGAARTRDGVASVDGTRQAFEALGGTVADMSERVAEIATAVEQIVTAAHRAEGDIGEVAAVAEESSASAEQVSASTQETSASAQEIASSAAGLATTADQLEQLVRRFKLSPA